jgi:hypothetical protein
MNKPSILLKKHARSLTKALYDVTLENLLGYNKKFFIGHLAVSQSQTSSQTNSFSSPCRKPPSLFYGLFAGVQALILVDLSV